MKAAELDGVVILEWGSDPARVLDTETKVNQPGTYVFEGYNVYQFPSRGASLASAKRIATFDLPSDPTVILDQKFDPISGQILSQPVQFGTNSGIKRYFQFKRDYLKDLGELGERRFARGHHGVAAADGGDFRHPGLVLAIEHSLVILQRHVSLHLGVWENTQNKGILIQKGPGNHAHVAGHPVSAWSRWGPLARREPQPNAVG